MGQILTVYANIPQHRQAVTLGDARYSVRLTWRPRLEAWYADLEAADGTPIWQGERVSTLYALGAGLRPEGRPDGALLVRGPEEYDRLALGVSVRIVFYSSSELPAAPANPYPVTVTIP